MPAALIRAANLADAKRLAGLAERTFRAAFADQNTAADMDLHCKRSYSEAMQAAEISNPGMATFVAEQGGQLSGYAQLRWGGVPACIAGELPAEIQRLYVAAEWHGTGVAQRLMEACSLEATRRGSSVIWLGVWERNPRAIAFYRKVGFVPAGEHIFQLGDDPQRDILMAKSLVPAA